ncbi:hypothetical protein Q7C36_016024 [Tachysurus vachellii]|uniref:Uncharacterized protein n=1 Tax=Tachysurus vachellii TaxID=175792 RepID=A0AA88SBL9_TACVA|nr:hypothetical protein Q7C36_016024 [Tachysurus vachellii]
MERWRDWRRAGWVWFLFMTSTWTLVWTLSCTGASSLIPMDGGEEKVSTNNSETQVSHTATVPITWFFSSSIVKPKHPGFQAALLASLISYIFILGDFCYKHLPQHLENRLDGYETYGYQSQESLMNDPLPGLHHTESQWYLSPAYLYTSMFPSPTRIDTIPAQPVLPTFHKFSTISQPGTLHSYTLHMYSSGGFILDIYIYIYNKRGGTVA